MFNMTQASAKYLQDLMKENDFHTQGLLVLVSDLHYAVLRQGACHANGSSKQFFLRLQTVKPDLQRCPETGKVDPTPTSPRDSCRTGGSQTLSAASTPAAWTSRTLF